MTFDTFEQLFLSDPETTLKTGLRFVHFVGLALGLGGATLLDLLILRFCLVDRIREATFEVFEFASKIVNVGLLILWASGLGFLLFYYFFDSPKLLNPKVHAKLMIVVVLSVNGIFVHRAILPAVRKQIGRSIFDGFSSARKSIFITSGAISVVSWYVPVALGAFSQLNNTVSALEILTWYLLLILIVFAALRGALHFISRHDRMPEVSHSQI